MKLLILGCGNLGYRHCQGLLTSNASNSCIFYLDLFDIDMEKSKRLLTTLEAEHSGNLCHTVRAVESLSEILTYYDLVIDASTANSRPHLVRQIMSISLVRWWIIEKPIGQSCGGIEELQTLFLPHSAWVNLPRRASNLYQSILDYVEPLLKNTGQIQIEGSGWNLASNAIHFMDLFRFLFKLGHEEILLFKSLINDWFPSKRLGFVECAGSLVFESGGQVLTLACKKGIEYERNINLYFDGVNLEINEESGTVLINDKLYQHQPLALQSEMTGNLLDQLVNYDSCQLPTLESVIDDSYLLSNLFANSFSVISGKNHESAPFT